MSKIRKYFLDTLKSKDFTDPFDDSFDIQALLKEFDNSFTDEEVKIIQFLEICNSSYTSTKDNIYTFFDKLNLNPIELRELLFIVSNSNFLRLNQEIEKVERVQNFFDVEKAGFFNFTNSFGKEVNPESAVEIEGDILRTLIYFTYSWKPKRKDLDSLKTFDFMSNIDGFKYLRLSINIFLNLKESAYNIIIFEQGEIIQKKDDELKIESGFKTLGLLRKCGNIRDNNHYYYSILKLTQLYPKLLEKRIGVEDFKIIHNTIMPIAGKGNWITKAIADSKLVISYSYFMNIKLSYFDGLKLFELLDILILIQECIKKILDTKKFSPSSNEEFTRIPIKFNEKKLIRFLSQNTSHSIKSVQKLIKSLSTASHNPYFWRKPFYKVGDYLFFSLAAIAAPNYFLYFDEWISLSGFSLDLRKKIFKKHILEEIDGKAPYEFKVVKFEELKLDPIEYSSNILFEASSIYVLVEILILNYSIEFSERDNDLNLILETSLALNKKAKIINESINKEKQLVKIIISNYNHYSGLQDGDVSVTDLMAFVNYIVVGHLARQASGLEKTLKREVEIGRVVYYNTEEQFNKNFKTFFLIPLPIKQVLQRLYLNEVQITPDFVQPNIFIDTIYHYEDDILVDHQIKNLESLLKYEYYSEVEDETIKTNINESISYYLSNIFSKIAISPYESYRSRIDVYLKIGKNKQLGIAHLSLFMLESLNKMNGIKIEKTVDFEKVEYEVDKVWNNIEKVIIANNNQIRLSEFKIEEGIFSNLEEKEIISLSIDILSNLSTKYKLDIEAINSIYIPLALLQGLSSRYNIENAFYTASHNLVEAFIRNHKFQTARDFCEEILIISINNKNPAFGWNALFHCFTSQKNIFEASIDGCIFLSSILVRPSIPDFLAVEALYGVLKFFRNFGYFELAKATYEILQRFELSEFDKQKISLAYFNTFFQRQIRTHFEILEQALEYVEANIENIIAFNEIGITPWLAFFYNLQRLISLKIIDYSKDFKNYTERFESHLTKQVIKDLQTRIFGNDEKIKDFFIEALLNSYETRHIGDFIFESQNLSMIASNLIEKSLSISDVEGLLLSGRVLNDQSFIFNNINVEAGSTAPLLKPVNEELKSHLYNYKEFILNEVKLKPKQLLIWIFNNLGKIHFIAIDFNKNIKINTIANWDTYKIYTWLKSISNFYFNSKKNEFSNPREEHYYNIETQEEDFEKLKEYLGFTNLEIDLVPEELILCTSIDLASFPHNLIENKDNFIGISFPVCNIFSIERFIENSDTIYLQKQYSISSWIPINDEEPTISWGFEILKPLLDNINAEIFTNTYPEKIIETDLNIFLAHGVTDALGFKAVYTNHVEKIGISYPFDVFGKGEVAILFICNSGSSHDALFSNSITSFAGELLKSGYKAVVAPFWPFDVTMSKIWLREFLDSFNQGYSISEAVYFANKQLAKYDQETSNTFYAPAGCLAMHLYGNPNIFVKQD